MPLLVGYSKALPPLRPGRSQVVAISRNQWSLSPGTGGLFPPEPVVVFSRTAQLLGQNRCARPCSRLLARPEPPRLGRTPRTSLSGGGCWYGRGSTTGRYTDEFKRDAVALFRSSGRTIKEVARGWASRILRWGPLCASGRRLRRLSRWNRLDRRPRSLGAWPDSVRRARSVCGSSVSSSPRRPASRCGLSVRWRACRPRRITRGGPGARRPLTG
jgi:hypothetical protein